MERVAGADGDELQHAGIAVAVNHAARAAVANEFEVVPVPDLAHRRLSEMAAIQIQIFVIFSFVMKSRKHLKH